MPELRVVDEQCVECGDTFPHPQRKWAVDCEGIIAISRKEGLWYGFKEDQGETLLELPEIIWTSANIPGDDPVCEDCFCLLYTSDAADE